MRRWSWLKDVQVVLIVIVTILLGAVAWAMLVRVVLVPCFCR